MTKGSFGELLKRERELREVTLNEVTVATRIPPRFLEAFEREEWEKLPGGVFNRGFVRAIARYLGLDEENLLSEYDLAYGEQRVAVPVLAGDPIPSPRETRCFERVGSGTATSKAGCELRDFFA